MSDYSYGIRWFSLEEAREHDWPTIECPCCGTAPEIGFSQTSGGEPTGVCAVDVCPVQTWKPRVDMPSWWHGHRVEGKLR